MEPRIARRALAGALIAGIVAELLFDRSPLGVNVPLATAAALALVTWLGPSRRPVDRADLWLPGVALLASLGPAFRTDPSVVALDVWLVVAAVSAWAIAVSGVAVTRRAAMAIVALGALAGTAIAVGLIRLLARSDADGALRRATRDVGRLGPVARGAIIAVPVVIGFAALLTSADAIFGRALDEALRLPFDLEDIAGRALFAVLAAGLVAAPLALASGALPVPELLHAAEGGKPATAPDPAAPAAGAAALPARRPGATEALVVMVAVDLLFGLFAAVQIVYLFGGSDTLTVVGMTYSDYARQGYFQLVGVVALAGLLLLGAHEVVGRTRAFLAAAGVLLLLTMVILASAAFRLELYQGAYGWTELRFFVAASIAWLGACLALAAAMLAGNRMRWLPHGLAMSAVAVTLGVSLIGPQAFVMDQNLARVLDPSLVAPGGHPGIDLEYGMSLGDDAIPGLVAALNVVRSPAGATLLYQLRLRRDELALEATTAGPLSWNLARERAREALRGLPNQ